MKVRPQSREALRERQTALAPEVRELLATAMGWAPSRAEAKAGVHDEDAALLATSAEEVAGQGPTTPTRFRDLKAVYVVNLARRADRWAFAGPQAQRLFPHAK